MSSATRKANPLRAWRGNRTLDQAASQLRVSRTTYWYLERGRIGRAVKTVIRIAEETGVSAKAIARVA